MLGRGWLSRGAGSLFEAVRADEHLDRPEGIPFWHHEPSAVGFGHPLALGAAGLQPLGVTTLEDLDPLTMGLWFGESSHVRVNAPTASEIPSGTLDLGGAVRTEPGDREMGEIGGEAGPGSQRLDQGSHLIL